MLDLSANLFSVAMYVLQALGLYTIAQRRGIKHAWLAWVPVGSVWILGSIADDFQAKTQGGAPKKRVTLLVLSILVAVLSVGMLVSMISTLSTVLTTNEIVDVFYVSSGAQDLYSLSEEEFVAELSAKLEARLTDERMDSMLWSAVGVLVMGLALGGLGVALAVIECICVYRLYESCDPDRRVLYLILSIFLGLQGLFIFLCRDKDVIPVPQSKEPWEV